MINIFRKTLLGDVNDNTDGRLDEHIARMRIKLIEIAATHTLDELLAKALDEICVIVDSTIGFYHFVEPDQKHLSLQQWSTRTLADFCQAKGKGLHYPIEQAGVWADCVREKKAVIHNDYASLKHKKGMPVGHAKIIRELVVPVIRKDKVVAILGVGNKPEDYNESDVKTVSYLSDVTWETVKRKISEEALIASEKRYRRLFEAARDGILILDADTGKVVDVNPFVLELLGYSYGDIAGKFIWEIGAFKDVAASKDAFVHLQQHEYIRYDDLPLETADGRVVEVEFVSNVYLVDQTKVIQCNIRDITERKKAEAERIRLLTAIEQVGETIIITDPDGVIQYVNPAFEKATGYTSQEAVGKNARLLNSGKQSPEYYLNLWETISGGNVFVRRIVNKNKDGTLCTADISISPIRDHSGKLVNYVAVQRDITEKLQLENQYHQAQKMESVGRLAGGVAHDFNNMLCVINVYTDLAMGKTDPSDSLYADLKEILKATARSSDITNRLLTFTRKQTISAKTIDVNGTVKNLLEMLRRLIGEDIDLNWLPEADLWPVQLDTGQFDQILVNLCVNSRDAISGVGNITIETHNATFNEKYCDGHVGYIPGDFVQLVVRDDGCGLDKETRDKIFEPFFTTKDVDKGTGLGLSMVFGIVNQNKGFIIVNSEPGKGSTFNIYLPLHIGEEEKTRPATVQETPSSHGEMVLLVEDELSLMRMVQIMLENMGYKVLAAATPKEAMYLAKKHAGKISLLVTDVVMPKMNGRDMADQIRIIYPNIKTLFMSGYTSNVFDKIGGIKENEKFIQKPFTRQDLASKVRALLDRT